MYNVEFLPEWYQSLQRRKWAVVIQAGLSLAIVLGLVGTLIGREWEIHRQLQIVAQNDLQLRQSNRQLAKLNGVLATQDQLRQQEHAINQLGIDLDATRVVNALETAMPPRMALTGLSVEAQEQPSMPEGQVSTTATGMDHWLVVRLQGIAPTDIEVAILMDRLSKVKYFDSVAMSYIRDRTEAGRTMRDFELRFRVNLNVPAEGKS
jgi:Tfp pilus assembly protein PilN